jgi:hypothetical protein
MTILFVKMPTKNIIFDILQILQDTLLWHKNVDILLTVHNMSLE